MFSKLFTFFILSLLSRIHAMPTDVQTGPNEVTYNPLSPEFQWTKYNIAAVTTASIVVAAGLAILTTLFFPMFIYKVCYTLGGCQTTMDNYVDRFLGVEGNTRRIKRDLTSNLKDADMIMNFLKLAMAEYNSSKVKERHERENIMKLSANHQIEKRSPIDYIEPILVMMSKAYNQYVDPELKKNFKKPPSIR